MANRTKKGVLKSLNPKNLSPYHFSGDKKATLASIYRNQAKARKPKVKPL